MPLAYGCKKRIRPVFPTRIMQHKQNICSGILTERIFFGIIKWNICKGDEVIIWCPH